MANIPIYGTLKNETPEGKLAVAAQIFDETEGKKQSEINAKTVRTTEQTLEEAQKEQVKKNIGLPIYAYFNDSSQEEQKKSGVSIDFRIFQEDTKNQVGNASIALGAMNKNMGVMSVTLGYQNVTSDGFGEGMGMMPGSFFMGSMLSDHDNDTFSAIGYRNNSVYKDSPESKRVGSYLTISVPYPYEHDIYGKNLVVFGTDENLYIHGIGGYDGGSLNGEAPILAEHKSLQEVLTDLDTRCPTAVEDGKTYGWKDGKWVELTAPAGGYNRALYEAAGAVFNEETGFYELNDITDIREQEMCDIYVNTNSYYASSYDNSFRFAYFSGIRTNICDRSKQTYNTANGTNRGTDLNYFCYQSGIEILVITSTKSSSLAAFPRSLQSAFNNARKLRKILGIIILRFINTESLVGNAFIGANALEEFTIKELSVSISFQDSPNLTKDSILYLIRNSTATSPITVTLHATAYAMAMADEDIQAALAEKTNVSLASA